MLALENITAYFAVAVIKTAATTVIRKITQKVVLSKNLFNFWREILYYPIANIILAAIPYLSRSMSRCSQFKPLVPAVIKISLAVLIRNVNVFKYPL